MSRVIIVICLTIAVLYLLTFEIWYAIGHGAAECILARDVITCVKVKEGK